jgi:non-ribosomal peptide synthetase component F
MAAAPEAAYGQYSLLSAAEQQQVLVAWNDTAHEYPREQSVVELFERQVERTPASEVRCGLLGES